MIEFKDVTIGFGEKIIVNNYNLLIEKGDKILFNAPSGVGKSTIMKSILGFVSLKKGEIKVDQEILDPKSVQTIRSKIAYVSQDVDLMAQTIRALIDEVFQYKLNKHLTIGPETIKELMELLELEPDLLEKNSKDLSGGERQRFGLLIALLLQREILLLDEITSGLDKHLKEKIFNHIVSCDKTVIVISHDDLWFRDPMKVVAFNGR